MRGQATGSGGVAGATKTLSGASRPAAPMAIATSVPSGPREPVVLGRAGQAACRPDELALGDGSQLIRGQRNDREGIETGIERAGGTASGRRGSPRRRRGSRRAASASSSVNGPEAVRVSAPR